MPATADLPEPGLWTNLLPPLLLAHGALAVGFLLLWWRQLATRNATSVDAGWSFGIGAVAIAAAVLRDGDPAQRWLSALAGGGWSLRLTWHLLRDRVWNPAHQAEDGRYRAMREHWGARAPLHFFWFYQAQALAALLFALPFLALAGYQQAGHQQAGQGLAGWQLAGLLVAAIGLSGETIADRQLAQHRRSATARRQVCRSGLWRYSRHPNYFFEWLIWCGFGLCAFPALGIYALLQPLLMFLLVRFVSGVPWTELQASKSRGEDYARYQRETNTFVPWWPRRLDDTA